MDENRIDDAMFLRRRIIASSVDMNPDHYNAPPCVLEVLIAFAERLDDILSDAEYGNRTAIWFWEFVSNLGLTSFDDDNFDEWKCYDIVQNWLDNNISWNGYGGLFPIDNAPPVNMRNLDMWGQKNLYQARRTQ